MKFSHALPVTLLGWLAFASPAFAATTSLHEASTAYFAAAGENLPQAYRTHLAEDAIIMFLHARGRAEWEPAVANCVAPTAKFIADPHVEVEAASGDLGYVWGDYRLELIRKSTGEPAVYHGRFVNVWRRDADGTWRLLLDNWAGPGEPATGNSPRLAGLIPVELRGSARAAEESFAAMASTGIRVAFRRHLADDGVIMFLNAHGSAEIDIALTAVPADARVFPDPQLFVESAAGDLAVAWGPYRFAATLETGPMSATGKFVTIWRRQPDGQWRIALDHGTQDPAPAPAEKS